MTKKRQKHKPKSYIFLTNSLVDKIDTAFIIYYNQIRKLQFELVDIMEVLKDGGITDIIAGQLYKRIDKLLKKMEN